MSDGLLPPAIPATDRLHATVDTPVAPGPAPSPPAHSDAAARPKPPRPPKAPKGSRGVTGGSPGFSKIPQPPKRMPGAIRPLAPLSKKALFARGALSMLVIVVLGFLLNLIVLSHLQHLVDQQELRATYTEQLAAGTAPVSEGTYDNVLLRDGEPVARIEIPSIGVDEIVVEGTSSGTLAKGPGHRRDTGLPGQAGASVLMGRSSAYGGPFGRIQELTPGETISVVTGQGEQIYKVIGVRYAGDASPAPLTAGEGRLVLETARGGPYMPTGVVRVDAQLVSPVQPAGLRDTTLRTLAPQQKELASDTTTVWALVFALQFLLIAEAGAVYSLRRVGGAKTWVVFVPILLLCGVLVADQLARLLPNLM